jgi:signal transduction histidine kinase
MAQHEHAQFMGKDLSQMSARSLAASSKHPAPSSRMSLPLAVGEDGQVLGTAALHAPIPPARAGTGVLVRSVAKASDRAKSSRAKASTSPEGRQQAGLVDDQRMNRLSETLCRRTAELTASTRLLQRDIIRRQAAEAALERSGKKRVTLLAESGRLREHFRQLTHKRLAAQEEERQRVSLHLQDEIVQGLLGIHVRLLTVKQAAKGRTADFRREIVRTQKLVLKSLRMIHRFAHELAVQRGRVR